MYDVCIIGSGVVGSAIARELSQYHLRIVMIERAEDVSQGASKANSGIVHGGYSARHGTLKAELCAAGNRMFDDWQNDLHFGLRRCGSLVLGFGDDDLAAIEALYENGLRNGARGLKILTASEVRVLEPNCSDRTKGALSCETAGVTSPYELTIALAENAVANGTVLLLNHAVKAIEATDDFTIFAGDKSIKAHFVINAAGVGSDEIARMVGVDNFRIKPRKGEYILFERGYGKLVNTVIFQTPTEKGKGILVTSTYHGNLMIGPNAEEVNDREDAGTTEERLKEIIVTARKSVPSFDLTKVITNFSGLRPTSSRKDFIIEESSVPRFVNVAGIDSPGLTSSPAIARQVLFILKDAGLTLARKSRFQPVRPPIIVPKSLTAAELKRRVKLPNGPERIVCRCEQVSEAEILDAMNRGIPVDTTDAIKRRTRAGMGQCQGQFCRPRVKALLARELGCTPKEIRVRADETAVVGRPDRSFFRRLAKSDHESRQIGTNRPEPVGGCSGN